MIIVNVLGGLGNQLFQYAAGRRLAILHKTELKLDLSGFKNYEWHVYSLKPFAIEVATATDEEIENAKTGGRSDLSKKIFEKWKRLGLPQQAVYSEPMVRPYSPSFLKTGPNVYLQGYWQSEKYFTEIQDVIRNEVRVTIPQDENSARLGQEIQGTNSVSLHIRRGNYVSIAKVNAVHGTCSLDYYKSCVEYVAERVKDPHFFVFSDDPAWAQANLHVPFPTTYMTNNDAGKDYEDLQLMSLCKHCILANSSFSWWGAWLSDYMGKIVLAPKKWFNDPGVDTSDLIPGRWVRL